jgi:maltose-binding protein MalE
VSEIDLPDAMASVGMTEFKLVDGSKITVRRTFASSITEKTREQAHEWLRKNGHGDIIKFAINSTFARGQEAIAKQASNFLKELGVKFTEKEAVHPQTLQAFVREQMASDSCDLPQDAFNVYPIQKSTIVRA